MPPDDRYFLSKSHEKHKQEIIGLLMKHLV